MSHAANDSFIAINRLLAAGEEVAWITTGPQPGAFFVAVKAIDRARRSTKIAADLGLNFEGVRRRPAGDAIKLRKLRIALADQYGGSMPSGWTRWMLEQFEFPFEVVFPQALDAGNLSSRYDVIIFPSGVGRRRRRRRPRRSAAAVAAAAAAAAAAASNIPAEYQASSGPTRRRRPVRSFEEVPRGRRDDPGGRAARR